MIINHSLPTFASGGIKRRVQGVFTPFKSLLVVAGAAAAMEFSAAQANAAGALWISAPNWSYSSALASSPVGTAYFWGLSAGPGTYSFAYAYSVGGGGSAYAFAQAAAGRGGMGAFQVGGLADPYAGNSVNISLDDPSNPGGFPTNSPGSDPFSTSYTVSGTGITLTGSGSELSSDDQLQAFVYNGATDMASLEAEIGASSDSGTTSSGDVTDLSTLASDFGLTPLDSPVDDPSSISSLNFTENTGMIAGDFSNVILVGQEGVPSPAPEPATFGLMGIGMAGLAILKKRRAAKTA